MLGCPEKKELWRGVHFGKKHFHTPNPCSLGRPKSLEVLLFWSRRCSPCFYCPSRLAGAHSSAPGARLCGPPNFERLWRWAFETLDRKSRKTLKADQMLAGRDYEASSNRPCVFYSRQSSQKRVIIFTKSCLNMQWRLIPCLFHVP